MTANTYEGGGALFLVSFFFSFFFYTILCCFCEHIHISFFNLRLRLFSLLRPILDIVVKVTDVSNWPAHTDL